MCFFNFVSDIFLSAVFAQEADWQIAGSKPRVEARRTKTENAIELTVKEILKYKILQKKINFYYEVVFGNFAKVEDLL